MSTAANIGQFSLGQDSQYRIGKCIGEGTFSKVRLGTHIPTGQKVAVKTLQKEKIIEQADIERVTREISILRTLRHPNIIQLYEIIETVTDIHLIMEYADGGELFDYIVSRKRLDESETVGFMQQILSGVEYIHKNGIVHRDLKPQNLLLDHNRNIKIVDFGLSNQYKPGEKLKTACGSPCYAAPEMIAGKKYECLGADIWSCGIILYAMLCGYLPFEDKNTPKLYKKIMSGDFELPRFLSQDSKDILKNILNVNPETRFKVKEIRDSKWYNNVSKHYEAHGIILGEDPIEPNEQIIQKLEKFNIEPSQVRHYVINNKHNKISAFYYLMKIKTEREPPEPKQEPKNNPRTNDNRNPRGESPIIYRPEKKEYYIPARKPKESKQASKNDSMNMSNIITSIVEANKNKLINTVVSPANRFNRKNDANFDKVEDFKLFPKKKTSSIYEPNTTTKLNFTARSGAEDKSFDFSRHSLPGQDIPIRSTINQNVDNPPPQNPVIVGEHPNKKRQELSQQLKLISIKIDKEILDLKKQNKVVIDTSATNSRKRESLGLNNLQSSTTTNRMRTHEGVSLNESMNQSRDMHTSMNQSINHDNPRDKTSNSFKESLPKSTPKIHMGPFNTQCVFLQNAPTLVKKIKGFLKNVNVQFTEADTYTIMLGEFDKISVESVQGINGLHLVKFNSNSSLNENIIEILAR